NALDGENIGGPNSTQQPLPSGDGFPGGNFSLTFTVNTVPPQIKPGSFIVSPSSDTNHRDNITSVSAPTFTGTITVQNPAINPLRNQVVVIDIDTNGDGIYDRMNVGTGVTDDQGNFTITLGVDAAGTGLVTNTSPLGDSPYKVGPDGLLVSNNNDNSG